MFVWQDAKCTYKATIPCTYMHACCHSIWRRTLPMLPQTPHSHKYGRIATGVWFNLSRTTRQLIAWVSKS
jgi:hypothetical protein